MLPGKKSALLGSWAWLLTCGLASEALTCHSMDRTLQISANEESAEGQGTEKKTEYLDGEVYI